MERKEMIKNKIILAGTGHRPSKLPNKHTGYNLSNPTINKNPNHPIWQGKNNQREAHYASPFPLNTPGDNMLVV